MPYVNVPNDLSKIKTKLAFNLTKRQLVCFGIAGAVGIPSYLLARSSIGNTAAMFLMLVVALPAFLLAMYEFTLRGTARKEHAIADHRKDAPARPRKGR